MWWQQDETAEQTGPENIPGCLVVVCDNLIFFNQIEIENIKYLKI